MKGRCLVEIDKKIMECQTYLAFGGETEIERVHEIQALVDQANRVYGTNHARKIPCIPAILEKESLQSDFSAMPIQGSFKIPIGLTYTEVEPFYLDFGRLGVMGLCGKENTGHKNFVDNLIQTLEENREHYPSKVFILDDVSRKFASLNSFNVVEQYTLDVQETPNIIARCYAELETRYNVLMDDDQTGGIQPLLVLIIQNNDAAKIIAEDFTAMD